MTNGRTGAKGRRGMPPKKVGNGTKTSKDHIGKKIRNKVNLFSVRAGLDIPFLFIILVLVSIGLVMLFPSLLLCICNKLFLNTKNNPD